MLIPSENDVGWEPGVNAGLIGGIPVTTEFCNAVTEGVDNTGATDVTAALQALLDACPSGQYVFCPDGTYRIDGQLTFNTGHQGVVLKGNGQGTVFESAASVVIAVSCGDSVGPPFGSTTADTVITAGLSKGSTQITLVNGDNYLVDRLLQISAQNDPNLPSASVAGYDYQRGQVVKITGRTGNVIDFVPPLYSDYGGGTLEVRAATTVNGFFLDGVGFEDFRINGNGASNGISFTTVTGCWVKGVRIREIVNYPISFQTCAACEVRESYIDNLTGGGSNRAGILMNGISASLIEDNIIGECQPAIEVNQLSSGNVIDYNFSVVENVFGFDSNHAPNPSFNLWEGNCVSNFLADGYFGSASFDTVYRNYFSGTCSLKRFTRGYAMVGNIFPTSIQFGFPNIGNIDFNGTANFPSDPWLDWGITGEVTSRTSDDVGVVTVSSLGQMVDGFQGFYVVWDSQTKRHISEITDITGLDVTIGNWAGVPSGDPLPTVGTDVLIFCGAAGYQELDEAVEESTALKGNYYVNSATTDPLDGDVLVDSLIYSSQPSWYTTGVWPPFDPSDPSSALPTNIPAGIRYYADLPPEAPEITSPCTVTGTPVDGQTLTAVPGSVTGNPPPTRTWRWERDGVPIVGATSIFYVLTGADVGFDVGPVQIETNGEDPPAESVATPLTILAFTGDILVVAQVANTDPVTELWRRGALTSGVSGPLEYYTVQHSGPYPTQPDNNYIYARFGTPQDNVYVFQGTISEAEAIASVP